MLWRVRFRVEFGINFRKHPFMATRIYSIIHNSSCINLLNIEFSVLSKEGSKSSKIYVPVPIFLALSAFGGWFLVSSLQAKNTIHGSLDSKHGDIFRIWNYDGKIAYEDIIEATRDFDMGHCIGTGGYGSVYRAELPNGRVVALKKLHPLEGQNPAFDNCFRKEAQILSGIRHRNIVKLFGFCQNKRCMFLIYDYTEGGP